MLKSEFIKKLEDIIGENDSRDRSIDLQNYSPEKGKLTIRISQMYDYVDVQFDQLMKLSELAQTRKINIGDKTSRGGCETCDFGSSYQIRLHLDEFWIPLEEDPDKQIKARKR
jgi:hypothetical protein